MTVDSNFSIATLVTAKPSREHPASGRLGEHQPTDVRVGVIPARPIVRSRCAVTKNRNRIVNKGRTTISLSVVRVSRNSFVGTHGLAYLGSAPASTQVVIPDLDTPSLNRCRLPLNEGLPISASEATCRQHVAAGPSD
jgi:hypothetical protein